MRSCMSPAGMLESHQKGFWIETPFQMQKTKALSLTFSRVCQKSGKAEYKGQQTLVFWEHAQEIPGGSPKT